MQTLSPLRRTPPFWLLPVLLGLLVALGACETDELEAGATLADIVENPDAFYGRTVIVSGEVDDVYGPQTFTIGGDGFAGELLVLSVDSIPVVASRSAVEPLSQDDLVQVTGVVRSYVRADIERDYGLVLDPQWEATFENRPVLVAVREAARMDPVLVTAREGGEAVDGPLLQDLAMVAGATDPAGIVGRPVEFAGATVIEAVGGNMFWVGSEDGQRLFVVLNPQATGDASAAVSTGQTWALTGVLNPIPDAVLMRDDWHLNETLIQELQAEPVYLLANRAVQVSESLARR